MQGIAQASKKKVILFFIAVTYRGTILELRVTIKFVPLRFDLILVTAFFPFAPFCTRHSFVLFDSFHSSLNCGD